MENEKKLVTIGIPAYKATKTINECLSSINIQTFKPNLKVIIASDNPNEDYTKFINRYDFDIKVLPCKKNTGPGLARQRCLDACDTDWITFIDADDVFMTPFSVEMLIRGIVPPTNQPNAQIIEVQGSFFQEVENNPETRMMPRNDVTHPWVFGRLYNVKYLRQMKIEFSELRAMEDGEFNWKIRMLVEGTPLAINVINEPIYLWRVGSEHSITRIGLDENGIPQYNYDLCQIGATQAAIRAIKFCRELNPFNGELMKFATETMVSQYFTYVECKERKPIFAEQNLFNAKRFYHECYKDVEHLISDKVLKDIYTMIRMGNSQNMLGIIPDISFNEFMNLVKNNEYKGEDELKEIRSKLPKEIIDNDIKTGVAVW